MERIDNLYTLIDMITEKGAYSYSIYEDVEKDTKVFFSEKNESYLVKGKLIRLAGMLYEIIQAGYEDIKLLEKMHNQHFGEPI